MVIEISAKLSAGVSIAIRAERTPPSAVYNGISPRRASRLTATLPPKWLMDPQVDATKLARKSLDSNRTVITFAAITASAVATTTGRHSTQVLGSRIMTRTTRGRRESSAAQASNGPAVAEPTGHIARNDQGGKNGHDKQSQPEIRALLHGLQAMRSGDFSVRLPGDWIGLEGKIADTFNDIVAANQHMAPIGSGSGHMRRSS